jgi:hypothetical protein
MGKNSKQPKTKQKRSNKVFFNELLDGTFLTKDGIKKNFKLMLLIVGLIFLYINNHYAVILQLSEIDTLQKELTDAKYEALTRTSDLMHEKRQSNILKCIKERGINLIEAEVPHYQIKRTVEEK